MDWKQTHAHTTQINRSTNNIDVNHFLYSSIDQKFAITFISVILFASGEKAQLNALQKDLWLLTQSVFIVIQLHG